MDKQQPIEELEVSQAVEWLAVQLYDTYIDSVLEDGKQSLEYHVKWNDISGSAVIYRNIWRRVAQKLLQRGLTIGM